MLEAQYWKQGARSIEYLGIPVNANSKQRTANSEQRKNKQ